MSAVRLYPEEPGSRLQEVVADLIRELGENPLRRGLVGTPGRVGDSLRFLTEGYGLEPEDVVNGAVFEHDSDDMVVLRDMTFYSLCEQHLLPFFGSCHVAYVPDGRVLGLSKIPRIIDVFAHRLQIQERLTDQIAKGLNAVLRPRGVAVVIEARHLCMEMGRVDCQRSGSITSSVLGVFRDDTRTRSEFLNLISRR